MISPIKVQDIPKVETTDMTTNSSPEVERQMTQNQHKINKDIDTHNLNLFFNSYSNCNPIIRTENDIEIVKSNISGKSSIIYYSNHNHNDDNSLVSPMFHLKNSISPDLRLNSIYLNKLQFRTYEDINAFDEGGNIDPAKVRFGSDNRRDRDNNFNSNSNSNRTNKSNNECFKWLKSGGGNQNKLNSNKFEEQSLCKKPNQFQFACNFISDQAKIEVNTTTLDKMFRKFKETTLTISTNTSTMRNKKHPSNSTLNNNYTRKKNKSSLNSSAANNKNKYTLKMGMLNSFVIDFINIKEPIHSKFDKNQTNINYANINNANNANANTNANKYRVPFQQQNFNNFLFNKSRLRLKSITNGNTTDNYPSTAVSENRISDNFTVIKKKNIFKEFNDDKKSFSNIKPNVKTTIIKQNNPSSNFKNNKKQGEEDILIPETKKQICKCRNSQCLKQYCDCYADGEWCKNCYCVNCKNTPENQNVHKKIKANPVTDENFTGCTCTNSKCQKKYCECFKNGVECSSKCRCRDCQNQITISTTKEIGVIWNNNKSANNAHAHDHSHSRSHSHNHSSSVSLSHLNYPMQKMNNCNLKVESNIIAFNISQQQFREENTLNKLESLESLDDSIEEAEPASEYLKITKIFSQKKKASKLNKLRDFNVCFEINKSLFLNTKRHRERDTKSN